MTDTVVVKPYYAEERAYKDGYNRFDDAVVEDAESYDLAAHRSSATYANNVLPMLRAEAGYGDRGHGTYQEHREVAAIVPGCEEDEPAEAKLLDARYVLDDLIDAWENGVYDAIEGKERGARLSTA